MRIVEPGDADLDLAGGHGRVDGPLGAGPDRALDPDDPLRPQPAGLGAAGHGGVEDDLDDALPVAEVDEDDTAVVAAVGHPAAEGDLGADVARPEAPA